MRAYRVVLQMRLQLQSMKATLCCSMAGRGTIISRAPHLLFLHTLVS